MTSLPPKTREYLSYEACFGEDPEMQAALMAGLARRGFATNNVYSVLIAAEKLARDKLGVGRAGADIFHRSNTSEWADARLHEFFNFIMKGLPLSLKGDFAKQEFFRDVIAVFEAAKAELQRENSTLTCNAKNLEAEVVRSDAFALVHDVCINRPLTGTYKPKYMSEEQHKKLVQRMHEKFNSIVPNEKKNEIDYSNFVRFSPQHPMLMRDATEELLNNRAYISPKAYKRAAANLHIRGQELQEQWAILHAAISCTYEIAEKCGYKLSAPSGSEMGL